MRSSRAGSAIVLVVVAIAGFIHPGEISAQEPQFEGAASPAKWDWIQIKTREWLKGELLGVYDEDLEFDSEEMDLKTFPWDEVREVRTANSMEVGLTDGSVVVGKLIVAGTRVSVIGKETVELEKAQILTITPWARTKPRRWSGKVSVGATVLAGNVDQVDANVNADLKRRSVRNRFVVDYIANVSNSGSTVIADNQRINTHWDHFLTDRFFLKPAVGEWFRDPFQNLNSRITVGSGAGYQLIDKPRMEWEVSAGLAYQQTRFSNVDTDDGESTGAFSASTTFEHDFTKFVELDYEYTFHITDEKSGRYNHHMVTTIETGWTKSIDFDVTFVWDRTQLPRAGADGVVPRQDDFRMVVALGIEF